MGAGAELMSSGNTKERHNPLEKNHTPANQDATSKVAETGGPAGLEPTRYGDWERKGRCIDF